MQIHVTWLLYTGMMQSLQKGIGYDNQLCDLCTISSHDQI